MLPQAYKTPFVLVYFIDKSSKKICHSFTFIPNFQALNTKQRFTNLSSLV